MKKILSICLIWVACIGVVLGNSLPISTEETTITTTPSIANCSDFDSHCNDCVNEPSCMFLKELSKCIEFDHSKVNGTQNSSDVCENDTSTNTEIPTSKKLTEPDTLTTTTTTTTTTVSTTTSTTTISIKTTSTTTTTTSTTVPSSEPVYIAENKDEGSFDGWSFFGGILLTVGFAAAAFVGLKYYKIRSRQERNYNRF